MCGHETTVCNSCRDRNCPQCNGAKRRDWLDSTTQLLLPGLDYYQIVFTIPDQLSSLALGNRRELFNLLFHSAWRALKQVIEDEQQFEAAVAMMLHTWNQHLESHVHVHAFVPAGGPSLQDPGRWKKSEPPPHISQKRPWLVDADQLRRVFRTEFLKGLRSLHRRGRLKLNGEWAFLRDVAAFGEWLQPLEGKPWVTHIQPPPKDSSAENVLKYLARYMTGGPISDRRIVAHENGQVTFTARKGTQAGGSDETEEVTLSGVEFVRRWSLHILPHGYTKTRRYGGYSNAHCKRYLSACRKLLSVDNTAADPPESGTAVDSATQYRCPDCESIMVCITARDVPSWHAVMHGPFRPLWYDAG